MKRRRIRFDQLVPARNLRRVSPDSPYAYRTVEAPAVDTREVAAPAQAPSTVVMPTMMVRSRPRDIGLRDWAIYLLHNAALIEHALMIQYLYATYSLDANAGGPAADNPANPVSASSWTKPIRDIAVEEMGHLLTVQNILRFVGGAITFTREDFPIPTAVYPFPFQLERLTKDVLAKYVYAEMPDGEVPAGIMSPALRADVEARAQKAAAGAGGSFVNHVGTLYATLLDVFSDPAFQSPSTSGFPPATDTQAVTLQAAAGIGWHHLLGNKTIVDSVDGGGVTHPVKLKGARLLWVNSINDVLAALSFIARQGEASDPQSPNDSHFGRFLAIYKVFPDEGAAGWAKPAALKVPTNPTTISEPGTPGTISHKATQHWARLCDVRYRILLMSLTHATAIPTFSPAVPNPEEGAVTEELDALVNRIFDVMANGSLSVGQLARLLTGMPRTEPPTDETAGAPFTMPYTTAIPDRRREQWQYHLDLLDSSDDLVAEIRKTTPDPAFPKFQEAFDGLDGMEASDAAWRAQVATFLAKASTT
jgi:hypothetical protein